MKKFVDSQGKFEIRVPVTFNYSLKEDKVHTFQEYEVWKPDAFQISFRKLEPSQIDTFHKNHQGLQSLKTGEYEYYILPDKPDGEFILKCWMGIVDENLVIFTLNYLKDPDPELDPLPLSSKIDNAISSFESFKLIDSTKSAIHLNSFRFESFLLGVGATSLILSKAVKNKAFIEATCILANQIDALLRVGIVLKKQIQNNNDEIETEWIYQSASDRKISEKEIYRQALDLNVIDQSIYDHLFKLYEDRNRVIHRFIISEITLAEVEAIAYEYHKVAENVNEIIYQIEAEQIRLGVGMTKSNSSPNAENAFDLIKGKIGMTDYHPNE